MSDLSVGHQLTTTIEKLSFGGGRGVARHQGFVLFIPDVIPNEIVKIEITKLKKSFGEAKLLKIIEPSPSRRKAPCDYSHRCGGCNWQHIEYSEQISIKDQLFRDFLSHFDGVEILPTIASPSELNYRNRIQLRKKGKAFGYHERSSHKLVNIDKCLLADDRINMKMKEFLGLQDGRYELFLDKQENVHYRKQNTKSNAQTFAQVNELQNQKLISTYIEWLEILKPNKLLELFCGSGNFSFPALEAFPNLEIIAIDGSEKLIGKAIGINKNSQLSFHCQDLSQPLAPQLSTEFSPDMVLLDPPRVGCSNELLGSLMKSPPKSIVYISCNPSTLKRDLIFLENEGYKVIQAQAFDMFPQTDHIESMTLVTRL